MALLRSTVRLRYAPFTSKHPGFVMSYFNTIDQMPEDPILGLPLIFAADNRSTKVNLGIGSYKDAQGKPQVLDCVRRAEKEILEKNLNKEYLPIQGHAGFLTQSLNIIFGKDQKSPERERIYPLQT